MFGQKFTKQGFFNAINNTKNMFGHVYHHTKNFLNKFDDGVKVAKKVYSIVEPPISHFVGQNNKAHQGVMKAVSGYDEIKHKVINHHENVLNRVHDVHSKFKKAGLNIGIE
jgi:hypothetical protein